MTASERLPFDIAIVGLGVVGTYQITREVEETIRRCNHAFVLDPSPGVVEFIGTLCPKVTDLMLLPSGAHRRLFYRKAASVVVNAAIENAPVCFATYGHPKIHCHPTTMIQRAAKVLNLKTGVLAGISTLDTVLVDLNLDPGFDGLQVYDATDLLVRRRPLQTDVACVIMQAPVVAQPFDRPGTSNFENLRLFQEYILNFYPADHPGVLVTSKIHPLLQPLRHQVLLGQLASALQQGSHQATLFIPPVRHREIADKHLADKVKVPADSRNEPAEGIPRRPGRPAIGPQSD